ncbi:hypothetical protein [Sphingobacterium sp. UBA2074]|uniref:hypothetical protein n=1 Tax=Sphingobacterium sp. UBA2074 TaxID=1947487 RepID=UPI00257A5A94|nr:hypothetical protein [Sphingobacterium sp. UBA2074]
MEFLDLKPKESAESKVVMVDEKTVDKVKKYLIHGFGEVNTFIDNFNKAHEGTGLLFNQKYYNALRNDRLGDVSGIDLNSFMETQPKFLCEGMLESYKKYIHPIYEEASIINSRLERSLSEVCKAVDNHDIYHLIELDSNNRLSYSDKINDWLISLCTITTDDYDKEIADKLELYINLENELRELLTDGTYAEVMARLKPDYRAPYHKFSLPVFAAFSKKYDIKSRVEAKRDEICREQQ